MYWIGVGFLIAIGFALAGVVLPFIGVLMLLAWEHKAEMGVGLFAIILICLAIAFPQVIVPTLFWGFIISWFFIGKSKAGKEPTHQEPVIDVQPRKPKNNIAAINIKKDMLIVVVVISVFTIILLLAKVSNNSLS